MGACGQGSSNAAQGQVNRHDLVLPSRTVADNALGEPSAAPHTAAALQQQPRKQYGTDAPLSSQVRHVYLMCNHEPHDITS